MKNSNFPNAVDPSLIKLIFQFCFYIHFTRSIVSKDLASLDDFDGEEGKLVGFK